MVKVPNAVAPSDRATAIPTAKFVRLDTAWSVRPQLTRVAIAREPRETPVERSR